MLMGGACAKAYRWEPKKVRFVATIKRWLARSLVIVARTVVYVQNFDAIG